ncbi:39S ribosomal protein L50, mitochondrial-like [Mizuhopecten yessoensis]|nr:39S ribosomal protein L50, mitochondrial-like [Mizuhopecten yessoensis]
MAASLRTVSCSRICTGLRCLQLGSRSQFPAVPCRNATILKKFWKGSPKPKPVEEDVDDLYDFPASSHIRSLDAMQCLRKRSGVSTKRGYSPPHDVEERIQRIAEDIFGEKEDWKETQLTDRQNKYQFLTRTIKEFDHNIPNMVLTKLDKVDNVVGHFSTEVRETSALEDISKLDLPKNLHMNLDYIRFHDEKEKLFSGKTAFPTRPTIVHSIKHKRQYKGSKPE